MRNNLAQLVHKLYTITSNLSFVILQLELCALSCAPRVTKLVCALSCAPSLDAVHCTCAMAIAFITYWPQPVPINMNIKHY